MIKEHIEKIIAKENLTFDEARASMLQIMEGQVNNSQIAALLIALKSKGEAASEVAGFASAMREKSVKIKAPTAQTVDVCGTGGDSSGTFNVSTTASFIVAGAGVPVAKHGNRSISSKSGSADVLAELGVNIELTAEQSQKALHDVGISFLFAPAYHPAMKFVMPVRKELATRTVFNILGPLTNPASTKYQLVGVFNEQAAALMAEAADYLQMEKVCFICTDNKYDEALLGGTVKVFEYGRTSGLKNYTLSEQSFDYPQVNLNEIQGSTPQHNAEIIRSVLSGKEKNPYFYVATANAALGLYSAGVSADLKACVKIAEDSVFSGKAEAKLNQLIEFGK